MNRWTDQFNTTLIKSQVTLFCVFNVGATGAPTLLQWNPPSAVLQTAGNYTNAPVGPATMPGAPNKYQSGHSGIYSITRNAVGKYTIALQDSFTRLLGANPLITAAGGTEVAPTMVIVGAGTNVASGTAPTIQVQFQNGTGVATELQNGDQVSIEFQLQNSAAYG